MVHIRTIFYNMYCCENCRYIIIPNLIALICQIHGLPPINCMFSFVLASLIEMFTACTASCNYSNTLPNGYRVYWGFLWFSSEQCIFP